MVGAGPSSVRTKSERARRLLVSGLGTLVAACSPPDAGTRAETTWQAPEPPAQAEPALSERIAQFERAVDEVTRSARMLVDSLVTKAPARTREVEAAKARERIAARFPPRR